MDIDITDITTRISAEMNSLISDNNLYKDFLNDPNYNDYLGIVCDRDCLSRIISENDAGMPPVKTLLDIVDERGVDIGILTRIQKNRIGRFMKLIFIDIIEYDDYTQRKNVSKLNSHGVRSAFIYSRE